jgi:hypothetical protein
LIGNQRGNRLDGSIGNDTTVGRRGDDVLIGGSGTDVLFAGPGDDRVVAGAGGDYVGDPATIGSGDTPAGTACVEVPMTSMS